MWMCVCGGVGSADWGPRIPPVPDTQALPTTPEGNRQMGQVEDASHGVIRAGVPGSCCLV